MNRDFFKPPPPSQLFIPLHFFAAFIDMQDNLTQSPPHLDAVRFINDTVHAHPEDWIVLKVDIEGDEYQLLSHLEKSGVLPLIDELACEFHFNDDPRLWPFKWRGFA